MQRSSMEAPELSGFSRPASGSSRVVVAIVRTCSPRRVAAILLRCRLHCTDGCCKFWLPASAALRTRDARSDNIAEDCLNEYQNSKMVEGISRPASYRWLQLFIGIVCMAMIANLQYGWTLFVNPISVKYGWTRAAIQVAFTIFVLTETWLVPIEGYLVDRFGPRPVVLIGGLLCGIAWVMNA